MAAKTNVVNITDVLKLDLQYSDLTHLYLPVDTLGNAVKPYKAIRLECWQWRDVRRQAMFPSLLLTYGMVKTSEDSDAILIADAIKHIQDTGSAIVWMANLHRHPAGDVISPKFKLPQSQKRVSA